RALAPHLGRVAADHDDHLLGDVDGRGIAADRAAVAREDLALLRELAPRGVRAVPPVGVPRREAEQAIARSAEDDRQAVRLRPERRLAHGGVASFEARALVAAEPPNDLEAFAELLEPDARRRKRKPVRAVFLLHPPRAEREHEPPAGNARDA